MDVKWQFKLNNFSFKSIFNEHTPNKILLKVQNSSDMQHTLRKKLTTEMLLLSYFIYFSIEHSLESDQLRHNFQDITTHNSIAVANRWIKTTFALCSRSLS